MAVIPIYCETALLKSGEISIMDPPGGLKGFRIGSKLICMVGRIGGGLYFLIEIELKMLEIPPITNLKLCIACIERRSSWPV